MTWSRSEPMHSSWPGASAGTDRWPGSTPDGQFVRVAQETGTDLRLVANASCPAVTDSGAQVRGERAPGCAPREQAAAEERPLEGAVAVDAAATETRGLADRVQPGERRSVRAQHTRLGCLLY